MKTLFKVTTIAVGLAVLVSACSDGDGGSPPTPTPGPTALEDQFGPAFGAVFRAGANTDPVPLAANTIIAVTLTEDPVPVP